MELVDTFIRPIKFLEPLKKVEYAGRVCWKSYEKMKDNSHKTFVKSIVNRGHTSVLEHENFMVAISRFEYFFISKYFEAKQYKNSFFNITKTKSKVIISSNLRQWREFFQMFEKAPKTIVKIFLAFKDKYDIVVEDIVLIYKNNPKGFNKLSLEEEDLKDFHLSPEELVKHIYRTFHIRTDRAVSHQIVRHRLSSFSQESQRYCDFTQDKHGGSVKFILPFAYRNIFDKNVLTDFETSCRASEEAYRGLITLGSKPEEARSVLPNATATEIIITSNLEQWYRIFALRCDSHAQPDIRDVCERVKLLLESE